MSALTLFAARAAVAGSPPEPPRGHHAPHVQHAPDPWGGDLPRPVIALPAELSEDVIDDAIAIAAEFDPSLVVKLGELRARDPALLRAKLGEMTRLLNLVELKRREPGVFAQRLAELRVDVDVDRLARDARAAVHEGRADDARRLRQELAQALRRQTEFRHAARTEYVCMLREHVESLESRLAGERRELDQHLAERMAELTREQPELAPVGRADHDGADVGSASAAGAPPITVPDEVADLAIEVARDIDGELGGDLAQRLQEVRNRDALEFVRRLAGMSQVLQLIELRRREPHLYQLKLVELTTDGKVERLAAELRAAHREGRAADEELLDQQLHHAVILQIAFRYQAREEYVRRLDEQVREMEVQLRAAATEDAIAQSVAKRLEEMTRAKPPGRARIGVDE
jgi:hypothetical protein